MPRDERSDTERLDLYIARVRQCLDSRLISSGSLQSQLSLGFSSNRLEVSTYNPDEETLRAFLLTFRQFISPKEDVYVNRIVNLLYPALDSAELRRLLRSAREGWLGARAVGGVRLTIDGHDVAPEHALDLWINGVYFHNDRRKLQELQSYGPLGIHFARRQVLDYLIDATNYVTYIADVIIRARSQGLLHI